MMGRIHSVESFGSVDGPGIRYVVFLQGCPLRCGYCHNPDTWTFAGGAEMSAEELFQKIRRYRAYFGEEGADGINTCLDTSGCVWNDQVEALLEETDTVLLDIKMTSEEDYARYIGGSLKQTMKFLSELHRRGIPTWVRQVIVEGLNDTEDNIQSLY